VTSDCSIITGCPCSSFSGCTVCTEQADICGWCGSTSQCVSLTSPTCSNINSGCGAQPPSNNAAAPFPGGIFVGGIVLGLGVGYVVYNRFVKKVEARII